MIFLYAGLILLLFSAQIVDVLGYQFRCNKNRMSWPKSTAISGVLFYLARLGLMFYATLQAMLREAIGLSIELIDKLSIAGMIMALIYLLIIRENSYLAGIIQLLVKKTRMFKVESEELNIKYANFSKVKIDLKLVAYSFLTNFFVIFCSLLPVNLVHFFPSFSMSLVYVSQILTVVAGFSWYALQEPRIIDYINLGKFDNCFQSLVLGKILSLIAITLSVLVFLLCL
jgi:hypothetical protein